MEQTLILIKPDAVQRGLIGQIISRFEQKGLKLVGLKMFEVGDKVLTDHYSHLADKPFFAGLKAFMQSSPVVAMVWEGKEAVESVRILVGPTNARQAAAGTIRGDFGMSPQNNLIHASDSVDNAKIEVNRFFAADELFSYDKSEYTHMYASDEK